MRHGYFTIINTTHNNNCLYWKLFIVIVKYKYKNWILKVQILYDHKDGDIISTFLAILQKWYSKKSDLQLQNFIIDDFTTKQHAVFLAFNT